MFEFLKKHKKMILLTVAVIVVIFSALTFMFNIFKKASSVVEVRDFSCHFPSPSVVGFTFKYPVFKHLENIIPDQENCALKIKDDKNNTLINIQASIGKGALFALSSSMEKTRRVFLIS